MSRRRRRLAEWAAAAALAAAMALFSRGAAAQGAPSFKSGLSYLVAYGPKQYPVLTLLLAMSALMLAIIAIIMILVLLGVFRRRAASDNPAAVPVARPERGLSFIYVGVALTVPALLAIASWTYDVLANVARAQGKTAFTVRVIGHQWWWEFQYAGVSPDRAFVTANELHIPVGKPVRLELETGDVIHSFWVPALSGKMDTIAGQRNVTWIQADEPGLYRGQCTEYCGLQHAHMALLVVAEPEAQFDAWWQHQLDGPSFPVAEPALDAALQGQATFMRYCAACHTVRGTPAGGRVGPDLSHIAERQTIAAGALPNTIGDLSGWIADPQHIKPGNYMPMLTLSGEDLTHLRSFLTALK
jgi:cytochrome c oxidase subunit 2